MFKAEIANTAATQKKLMKPKLAAARGFKYGPEVVRTGTCTTTLKMPELASLTLAKTVREIAGIGDVGFTKLDI